MSDDRPGHRVGWFVLLLALPVLAMPVLAAEEPFHALRGLALAPLTEQELAAIEGQGAEFISTTFIGVPATFVLTPSGTVNGTAHGDTFIPTPTGGAFHQELFIGAGVFSATGTGVTTPSGLFNGTFHGQTAP